MTGIVPVDMVLCYCNDNVLFSVPHIMGVYQSSNFLLFRLLPPNIPNFIHSRNGRNIAIYAIKAVKIIHRYPTHVPQSSHPSGGLNHAGGLVGRICSVIRRDI